MMMLVTVSAIVLALAPLSLAYSEVGCFVDKPERILSGKSTSDPSMTINMCVKTCSDEGNYFAAVENSNQCFCGDHLRKYEKKTDDACSMKCSGNQNQFCGGHWLAFVYTTDVSFFYVGCYLDKTERILEGGVITSETDMTPKYCIDRCRKNKTRFALTENSKQCFCGNHLKDYPKKPDSECSGACTGDATKMCGDVWRGSLYLINYDNL